MLSFTTGLPFLVNQPFLFILYLLHKAIKFPLEEVNVCGKSDLHGDFLSLQVSARGSRSAGLTFMQRSRSSCLETA